MKPDVAIYVVVENRLDYNFQRFFFFLKITFVKQITESVSTKIGNLYLFVVLV